MTDLSAIQASIRKFRDAREWMPFHNPKNMACSVAIEAAELLEQFQWKSPEECLSLTPDQKQAIAHEIADVAIYLIELADNLSIDLFEAIEAKLVINDQRYPVSSTRGSAAKYSDLRAGEPRANTA